MTSAKPYSIAKRTVWEAYQQVKANRGSAGIDDETIAMFEQNLPKNLYKLWNRMSSGSYFPPPVKQVQIPKGSGGFRMLGIPTVSDRIAQTAVKLIIELIIDPVFHPDSYGYRPGKSAKQAIAVTKTRCWQYDWVVEFDIKAAFDRIDHALLMKAVRTHIKENWILLYIERWLTAPFETDEGVRILRERGTPQGGVVSPILMNLFMHYAFDCWMKRTHSHCPFARYADDAVVHCRSQKQSEVVMQSIAGGGAVLLDGMEAVEGRVEDFVDDVVAAGDEGDGDEGQSEDLDEVEIEKGGIDAEGDDDAGEDEEIFDGMVKPGDGEMGAEPFSERYSGAFAVRHRQGAPGGTAVGWNWQQQYSVGGWSAAEMLRDDPGWRRKIY